MLNEKTAKQCGWIQNGEYDLIVVGAGPAGIGAAVAAGRKGLKTAILEREGYAGGVGTQSCVPLYFGFGVGGKQSTAGLSEEFIRRMDEEGAASLILNDGCAMPEFRPIAGRKLTAKVQLQPEQMKRMYRRMLKEAHVECVFYAQMADAVTEGDELRAVLVSCLEGPRLMRAKYFVDATGDGLLFRQAGVPVRKYAREDGMHHSMFFFVGGVTPFDHQYNCMLYQQAYREGRLPEHVWDHFGYSVQLNPGVVQIAVCYAEGDALDSRDMTRMDGELRESVFAVFDFLRREMPGFSQCYLLETAGRIGVRCAQGIVGKETFTEEMVAKGICTEEPVVLTSRSYGAHGNHGAKKDEKFMAAWAQNREGFSAVPMGTMISPALRNALAAGRCISADPHIVGTFRMMNTCMTIGEAAGLMTALCAQQEDDIRTLPYSQLRPELQKAGFILSEADVP